MADSRWNFGCHFRIGVPMRFVVKLWLVVLAISSPCLGRKVIVQGHDLSPQIIDREHYLTKALRLLSPFVEAYIYGLQRQPGRLIPARFYHFFSFANFDGRLRAISLASIGLASGRLIKEYLNWFAPDSWEFVRSGFVAMAYPDPGTFDLKHYRFELLNEEALDGIECYVIGVTPIPRKRGLFNGRIWVEKETLTIIRFDGIYQGSNILQKYFHFDSRRRKDPSGLWVPSVITSGEMDDPSCDPIMDCPCWHEVNFQWNKLHFQAVNHFFGYKTGSSKQRPSTLAH
jgi:hypothetical protein